MKNGKKKIVHYLAIWGCISTAIVYTSIGVIAILSFLRIKKGGAGENSLLVFFDRYFIGKLFIWIILLGMIGYIIWRIYETINDPYNYGTRLKGILKRSVIALSSVADALIAYIAIQALFGKGAREQTSQPAAQRETITNILANHWGQWLVITIGIITSIAAIVQFGYVITLSYMERLDIDHLARWKKSCIHVAAWAGHFARGFILCIIGFFFIKAGMLKNAYYIVNTDKAFDFIRDDVGHVYFIGVAIGTICYGFFMFAFGVYYHSQKKNATKVGAAR
jgi:hypothetical protein